MLEQAHQHAAGGVDPDDGLRRQVHELEDLGVRGLLERVGDVVRVGNSVNLAQVALGSGDHRVGDVVVDLQRDAGGGERPPAAGPRGKDVRATIARPPWPPRIEPT